MMQVKQIDRIRNMNAEEMAEMLKNTSPTICVKLCGEYVSADEKSVKAWLESEVEYDTD